MPRVRYKVLGQQSYMKYSYYTTGDRKRK